MSTEWLEERSSNTLCSHALGQKIHKASGKKIPQDHNGPHDLTRVWKMMMMMKKKK
jgi:hypothetical protein